MQNVKIEFPKTNIVGCRFVYSTEGNRHGEMDERETYYYKVLPEFQECLKVGDTVVVNCSTGFQVVQVSEINAMSKYEPTAYVVGIVDISAYEKFLEAEKTKARLKEALRARKAELEEMAVYELLASKDEDFAAMLKQFQELGGTFND